MRHLEVRVRAHSDGRVLVKDLAGLALLTVENSEHHEKANVVLTRDEASDVVYALLEWFGASPRSVLRSREIELGKDS